MDIEIDTVKMKQRKNKRVKFWQIEYLVNGQDSIILRIKYAKTANKKHRKIQKIDINATKVHITAKPVQCGRVTVYFIEKQRRFDAKNRNN